jgi:hypothetical protein
MTCGTCIGQPVQRLATGWTVRGFNPDGGKQVSFPQNVQNDSRAYPTSYSMGTRVLYRVKAAKA